MELLFAQRLKELRKEKGLTQADLSSRMGYGYTTIGNYEKGRNEPSLSDLMLICEVLDVSADYLVGLSDVRKPYMIPEKEELEHIYRQTRWLAEFCHEYLEKERIFFSDSETHEEKEQEKQKKK